MKWKLMILLLSFSTVYGPPLPGRSVSAEVGETAILPVKVDLTEDSELLNPIIKWRNERGGIVHDYWYIQDSNEYQDERFQGRTSLFSREEIVKGNVSLKISNVTKSDEGNYTCEVHVVDGDKTYKVYLCVLEIRERRGPTESPEPEQPVLALGQIVGIVIGVLIVIAALIVAVFLYRRRKATKRTYHRAKADNLAMETLKGGQEPVQSSEDPTSICAQQQNEENTNNEPLDC